MAELEGVTHSGICASDLPESEEFYVNVLGARFSNRSGFHVDKAVRGRSLNTVVVLADYLIALMVPKDEITVPPKDQYKGANPFRHAFWVSQDRFPMVVDRLKESGVSFEGPVAHPLAGPLGESIYMQDPAGNFLEICWRRDRDRAFNPINLSGKLTEH
ncbi:MAG: Glyoxalase/bleomycin resistance protein/dioxygenase [Chloroflexi bacterium]|nr:Glyoxalase/bleomycin resistance protein/dioxygenase [Chloroflexota bacterium]